MKKAVRKIITKLQSTNTTDLIQLIRKSECTYVSFDIFDTLISRNVMNPEDIFWILESKYEKNFGKKVNIHDLRIQAEKRAEKISNKKEINLHDIYSAFDRLSIKEKEWLYYKELQLEKDFCTCNKKLFNVYQWCLNNNKKIIITSDMYLPLDIIQEILNKEGYIGWEHIFLSSEYNARKSTGELFEIIKQNIKTDPQNIIHIGDSVKGDYLMPRRHGIKSILINSKDCKTEFYNIRIKNKSEKKEWMGYNILNSFIKNNIKQEYSYYEKIGYEVIGPILYGYSKWLEDRINNEKITKIFFLAREGYLLDRAFSIINQRNNIKHTVIQVSRQATAVPLLYRAKNIDDMLNIITITRENFTLRDMLISCGFTERKITNICKKESLVMSQQVLALTNEQKRELFNKIKEYIEERSNEQYKNIIGYLKQFYFEGKLAVCDVGWHGTIQMALQNIIPQNEIYGFYLGKKHKIGKKSPNSEAFLFDEPSFNHQIEKEIMSAPDIFELFFLSTNGSALEYRKNNENYYCVEKEPEQTKENIGYIAELQEAACKFVSDFYPFAEQISYSASPTVYEAAYSKFINPPSIKSIDKFKKFSFLNVTKHSITAEHNLGFYIFHPIKFKIEFLNNGCKSFFLRSVFKFGFPYANLIDFLRKFDRG